MSCAIEPIPFAPKLIFTVSPSENPLIVTVMAVPLGPEVGVTVTVCWLSWALAIGITNTANVNMLRKISMSVALLTFFSALIKYFCNELAPLNNDCFSQI